MMRSAPNAIDAHSESAAMVGDRMDTDVVSGLEAGMHTVLVLTGITSRGEAERFPYRPSRIVDSIADLIDELGRAARNQDYSVGCCGSVVVAAGDWVTAGLLTASTNAVDKTALSPRRVSSPSPRRTASLESGRRDSNSGPLVPQTSALTRLRHAPWAGS